MNDMPVTPTTLHSVDVISNGTVDPYYARQNPDPNLADCESDIWNTEVDVSTK